MTGQQLKNAILQEAIQGRLVPNVLEPGEKTGAELLHSISDSQKKEKTASLSMVEDGPWELPQCWCWCKYNDLFEVSGGSQPPKSFFVETPREGYVRLYQIRDYGPNPIPIYVPKTMVSKFTSKGDILIARYGGSLGKIFWAEDGAYNVAMAKSISRWEGLTLSKYLFYFYHTQLFRDVIFGASSRSAQAGFNKEDLESLLFPLPPLSIQKAIVAKIEELFPLVDEYDKAAGELETLNKILPDKLRKSVLQEAIHGNLIPNDIPEGEATGAELLQQILKERQDRENKEKGKKAKKLTLSTIDEEPWELPDGWCWCKLKDIIDFTSSGTTKNGVIASDSWILDLEDIEKETGRLICKKRFGDVKSKSDKRAFKTGNVLYSKLRPYLNKCIIADEDGYCTTEILAFDFGPIFNRYAQSFLMSPYFVDRVNQGAAGVKMPRVNNAEANDTCFPIPPLPIQHRIVEKIEEVFAAIDKL